MHRRGIGPDPAAPPDPCTELFRREHDPMLRLAVLIVGSREAAEDVVAEAFATVDARWDDLTNPGGYLRSCVVNGCRMALRRRSAEERANRRLPAPRADELPESLADLATALGHLDDRQRCVIAMRYLEDLPDDDIATVLGCRQATVRSIARRALRRLREELS